MQRDFLFQIQEKLIKAFSSKSFLEKTNLQENDLLPFVRNNAFIEELSLLYDNTKHPCQDILNLCKLVLINIFNNEPSEGWLAYIYKYTLNSSFPHLQTVIKKEYEVPIIVYLSFLRIIMNENEKLEKNSEDNSFLYLEFLSKKEINNLHSPAEYKSFLKQFNNLYVLEMMYLYQELTNINVYDHTCTVNNVALNIGKQLLKVGVPVDLGRVSGAAAGHNLGRLAYKDGPYDKSYGHYYTKIWFENNNVSLIGNIAIYHSIWDLELEILPLESLILIYSNFRTNNKKPIHIQSLETSYGILLERLRHSDEDIINRFKKAYNRLSDFESYLKHLGVQVDLLSQNNNTVPSNLNDYFTLMHGNEIVENLKFLAIEHNIYLMFKLRSISDLNSMIEAAKSSPLSNTLKSSLNILTEYSPDFTQKQKLSTLHFLFDLLVHPEEDVRKMSAQLMGIIIGNFDEEYKIKIAEDLLFPSLGITGCDLFEKYINTIIQPDHKIIDVHKERLGECLKTMIDSLFVSLNKSYVSDYRQIVVKYLKELKDKDFYTQLNLLQLIKFVPWKDCTADILDNLESILINSLQSENEDIRLIALDRIDYLLNVFPNKDKFASILLDLHQKNISLTEKYLSFRIKYKLDNDYTLDTHKEFFIEGERDLSNIYLMNLKSNTSWISKKTNIEYILDYVKHTAKSDAFYTAMHFCNLIKVSSNENVRVNAGRALLNIITYLSPEQKNDIAIELIRSIEIESFEPAAYIPEYLGQVLLYLNPNELDEQIKEFSTKVKRASTQTIFLILKTIGITIENYKHYDKSFSENEEIYLSRLERLLGILLVGYSHYTHEIKQESFAVLGNIFNSSILNLEEKQIIFNIIAKKILVSLSKPDITEPLFMNNAASLNRIYRFISEYINKYGLLKLSQPNKIAFFPGTFDPFSLSNKETALKIRDMGYEVYLAVDEFSWSKSTQPYLQRQKIISMSISDERNIYIFPEEISISIANPQDMLKLKDIFDNKDITIVVGSNVIVEASCYKNKITENSIHHFSHIIIKRQYSNDDASIDSIYKNTLKKLSGSVIEIELPDKYNSIRSSLIRECIDENRDISNLVDPLILKYIYDNGLYLRNPQFKCLIQNHAITVKHYPTANKQLIETLTNTIFDRKKENFQTIYSLVKNKNAEILVLYDTNEEFKVLGFSIFHSISSSTLYSEFENHYVSEHIRKHSIGRMIVIDGIFTGTNIPDNAEQIILSETLALTLSKDYTYAVYKTIFSNANINKIYDILKLQGFEEIISDGADTIYDVDMSKPCALNLDVLSFIKEPFRSNAKVIEAVKKTRIRLQEALVNLFPGHLVLSFEREALYQSLIEKVCKANNVPEKPLYPSQLGPNMCVPFGQILKEDIVPNTITKALHTEKIYYPDASKFFIGSYPQYLSLENQIKILRSFNKPIILLDDILHKGYRIKALDPILNKEELKVQKIIVGILSSRGKELMDIQGRQVDAAYYIPNLKNWFTEAMLYPFIGGDSISKSSTQVKYLLPSLNLIFPYAAPFFIKGASIDSLMYLSKVCIENAMTILSVLEKEYQYTHERSLTLSHLGEVLVFPRCPDKGYGINHDYNHKASTYLASDLEHLSRMSKIVNSDDNNYEINSNL